MAMVVLINHVKNDLLSLSGSIISSRKARKDNIVNNLKRAKRANDTKLSFELQNELTLSMQLRLIFFKEKLTLRTLCGKPVALRAFQIT